MIRLLTLWLVSSFCLAGMAQDFTVRQFTAEDGLPSGEITHIYQDSRRFLWISTDAGLSRYDGKEFISYSQRDGLPFSLVEDISEDDSGRLWIAHGRGLACFDGKKFRNFSRGPKGEALHIRDILAISSMEVLACGKNGVYLVKGDSLIHFDTSEGLISNNCFTLEKTRGGRVFIGMKGGICEWKNDKIYPIHHESAEDRILTLTEDPYGYLWIGFLHNSVRRIKLSQLGFAEAEEVSIPNADSTFTAGFIASDKRYIYVLNKFSIAVYEGKKLVKVLPGFLHVPSDVINAVSTDREGNVWVGSLFGLWRLSPAFSIHYPEKSTWGQNIYNVKTIGPDSVLFTDGFYMYTARQGRVHPVYQDKPLLMSEMYDFERDASGYDYFVAMIGPVLVRDPSGKYSELHYNKNPLPRAFRIIPDGKGNLILGANSNIYRLRNGKSEPLLPENTGLENALDVHLGEGGDLWVGTNNGLASIRKGKWTTYPQFFDSQQVVINALHYKNRLLYVGTKGMGLYVFKVFSDSLQLHYRLSAKDGLPSDYISAVITDKKEQVWISTYRGISKLLLSGNGYYFSVYSSSQGFPDAFWPYSHFTLDNVTGKLWIGCSRGLIEIDPEREKAVSTAPHLQLLSIQSGKHPDIYERRKFFDLEYNNTREFDFSENDITFSFNGISLNGSEKLRYSYLLDGMGVEWMEAPENGILTLNNLMPGTYRLHLKAYDPAKQLSSNEVVYSFVILRPFWMSGWFYFILLLLFIGSVYGILKWRIRRNERKQDEKLEISRQLSESRYLAFQARMNPHFIFNSLNAIQYFITNNDKKSSLTYLSKFARLLRQILDNSKAMKIPLREEIDLIRSYLEMEAMRFDNHFRYEISVDETLEYTNVEVPGMLLQPFVENAILHGLLHKRSGEGLLQVSLRSDGAFVICTILDNGVGREESSRINARRKPNHKSYGMEIAQNRLQLLNDSRHKGDLIEIEDLYNPVGTKVTIKLPVI